MIQSITTFIQSVTTFMHIETTGKSSTWESGWKFFFWWSKLIAMKSRRFHHKISHPQPCNDGYRSETSKFRKIYVQLIFLKAFLFYNYRHYRLIKLCNPSILAILVSSGKILFVIYMCRCFIIHYKKQSLLKAKQYNFLKLIFKS